MKQTEFIMGMPVTVMSDDPDAGEEIFDYFRTVDQRYSPFIESSDVEKINRGELAPPERSRELQSILDIADQTKHESDGYFDVWHNGVFDPSGIVKGWAIQRAAKLLGKTTNNFYIEAGGDIQVSGHSQAGKPWRVGVRNPFNRSEIIATVELDGGGAIATSGTAIRGQHIYNPHDDAPIEDIVSITVVGPKIIDADRFATAAFAMGRAGINFIEKLPDYEGYLVDKTGIATMTRGWQNYVR
jgi:thiamine biosynthesis lipoprotein